MRGSVRPSLMLMSVMGMAPLASAQAWVPPKGEGTLTLGYQGIFVRDHIFSRGEEQDRGHIRASSMNLDLSYSISDRLAVLAGLPFMWAKYNGGRPHSLPWDDGTYHSGFQDFRFEARFLATSGGLAVTPFAAFGLPSHDYPYFAHSALGPHLREGSVGVNLGRRLDPILPDAFAHVRYRYTLPQSVHGIRSDRSNIDLDLGYSVSPTLTARVMGAWQFAHGGIDLPVDGTPLTVPFFREHDQIAAAEYFNLGIGASYAATGSLELFVAGYWTSSGRNTHALRPAVSVGASVNFSPARMAQKWSAGR
jgi:hypothetical protein